MRAIAVAMLLAACAPASAKDVVNDSLPGCKHYIEVVDRGSTNVFGLGKLPVVDLVLKATTMGECLGIVESMSYMFYMLRKDNCRALPKGVTLEQKIRVVILYVDKRPNRFNEELELLAYEAMEEAWPCK
jgi:hypothetical protein